MGYTHYWYRVPELPQETFDEWTDDARQIISAAEQQGVRVLGSRNVPRIAAITRPDRVAFNGSPGETCETFHVPRIAHETNIIVDDNGFIFDCCKTRELPYDLVVTACLIRLAYRFPEGVRIASDGDVSEWEEGRQLCERLFGYARVPFRDEVYEETA